LLAERRERLERQRLEREQAAQRAPARQRVNDVYADAEAERANAWKAPIGTPTPMGETGACSPARNFGQLREGDECMTNSKEPGHIRGGVALPINRTRSPSTRKRRSLIVRRREKSTLID
jgi:hypothetical protein